MFKKFNKNILVFAVLSIYANSAVVVKADTILDLKKESIHTFVFTGDMFLGQQEKEIEPKIFNSAANWILQGKQTVVFNLEQTLGSIKNKPAKCSPSAANHCFLFNSSEQVFKNFIDMKPADANWVFNQANNHSMDYGQSVQEETLKIIQKHSKSYSVGTSQKPYSIVPQISDEKESQFVIIGASPHKGTNEIDKPLLEQVRKLKEKGFFPIVVMHMGAEGESEHVVKNKRENFLGRDRGNIYQLSRDLIDEGAVAVVGHGPHVIRPMQWYKGKLIAYSLGNFLAPYGFSTQSRTGQGSLLKISFNNKGEIVSHDSKAFVHTRKNHSSIYQDGKWLVENENWKHVLLPESSTLKLGDNLCRNLNNESCDLKNQKPVKVKF